MSATDDKANLRATMKARRSAMPPETRAKGSAAVAAHGLACVGPAPGAIVSGFLSIGEELDTAPVLSALQTQGYRLCLPVMQGKGRPLIFRAWAPGDAMDEKMWGIREPKADRPVLTPDVLLVPLLAFDRQGYRLGYGGGFYDRTLRELRAKGRIVAVGLGFDEQGIDAVPHLDYDEPVDWVLTPSGPLRCRS